MIDLSYWELVLFLITINLLSLIIFESLFSEKLKILKQIISRLDKKVVNVEVKQK